MNKDRILKLADYIENSKTYDQRIWHYCNSPACIAGHAVELFADDFDKFNSYTSIYYITNKGSRAFIDDAAQELLGLSDDDAFRLFEEDDDYENPSNKDAALMLRRFAETGRIIWETAQEPVRNTGLGHKTGLENDGLEYTSDMGPGAYDMQTDIRS